MPIAEQVHEAVVSSQDDVLAASRRLTEEVTREATKVAGPLAEPITGIVGGVFDFARSMLTLEQRLVGDALHIADDEAVDQPSPPRSRRAPATGRAQRARS